MKNSNSAEWWRSTSVHMWKAYFSMMRDREECHVSGHEPTEAEQYIYDICDRTYHAMEISDQEIVKMYFTARWGDDIYAVEDYSLRKGIQVNVIWIVIKRAMRAVVAEIGLIDRKEVR